MMMEQIHNDCLLALEDLNREMPLSDEHILVIGTSTSEVFGEKIGTNGREDVSGTLFSAFLQFQNKTEVHLAFQCCEHLNRALVVERSTQRKFGLEIVSVVPIKEAGGAMATYAYNHFQDPVVVEFIKADAGIDIGDTLIGMHLKHVAVPVRSQIKQIGQAHLTLAKTRPKLIGGARAVYERKDDHSSCS